MSTHYHFEHQVTLNTPYWCSKSIRTRTVTNRIGTERRGGNISGNSLHICTCCRHRDCHLRSAVLGYYRVEIFWTDIRAPRGKLDCLKQMHSVLLCSSCLGSQEPLQPQQLYRQPAAGSGQASAHRTPTHGTCEDSEYLLNRQHTSKLYSTYFIWSHHVWAHGTWEPRFGVSPIWTHDRTHDTTTYQ